MELENQQATIDNQGMEKRGDIYIHVDPGAVRRKLFQEESADSNNPYQEYGTVPTICEQGPPICPATWSKDRQNENNLKELKASDKKREVN